MRKEMKYNFELDLESENALNKIIKNIHRKSTILEFGPANGRMTRYLKEHLECQVYIVEYNEEAAKQAQKYCEDFLIDNIENFGWIKKWENIKFDYMVFADVLEHLSNPQKVLYCTNQLLKEDGKVLLSVPNVAYNSLMINLFNDTFEYTSIGLLDNTHIHLFAYNDLERMCENAGYSPVCRDAVYSMVGENEVDVNYNMVRPEVADFFRGRKNGDVYQYVYMLQKKSWVKKNNIVSVDLLQNCGKSYEIKLFINSKGIKTEKSYYFNPLEPFTMEVDLRNYDNVDEVYIAPIAINGCARIKVGKITESNEFQILDLEKYNNHIYYVENQNYYISEEEIRICLSQEALKNARILKIEILFVIRHVEKNIIDDIKKLVLRKCSYDIEKDKIQELENINARIIDENKLQKEKYDNLILKLEKNDELIWDKYKGDFENIKETISSLQPTIDNIQHTVNDMLYVSQNSSWYNKAMKNIKGENCNRRIQALKEKWISTIVQKGYRLAKHYSWIYKLEQKTYVLLTKKSVKIQDKLDQLVWNTKEKVDGISAKQSETSEQILNPIEQCDIEMPTEYPMVSVIVPNYNHAPYLRQRLDTIYNQTYQKFEVILLDDCSTDNSRDILKEYAEKYAEKTVCIFNDKNVGRANLQWNKGIEHARGKYIWIAESDDWCDLDFLEKLVPRLDYQSVMIAFARSVFMTDGKKTWSTEEYLYDLPISWELPFTMSGFEAVKRGFAIKNLIPNASSAIFRNIGKIPDEVMNIWENIKLSGDWIFYLYLIKGGALSYTNETTNYYRIHKKSTSLEVQKTAEYYKESEIVSCYVARNFCVDAKIFEKTLKTLQRHYIENGFGVNEGDVCQWYHLDKVNEAVRQRMPNILICNFAMKMGGGEIFPIHLANALKNMGAAVTFCDCRMEDYDEKVRNMLAPNVPLIELRTQMALKKVVDYYGIEVVHSHHGCVDKLVSELLEGHKCKQIITLHGMYEAIDKNDLKNLLIHVTKTCHIFAYIANKNLIPFKEFGYFEKCNFYKIGNGLFPGCPAAVKREKLGIPENAFVLCLVSRARFDKGWLEAVEVVKKSNENCSRPIHLILVGEGEAYEVVKNEKSKYVHVVGQQENPRAFFATSDMGFLPSRFAGESFPLTVIESLMCGKPVLASNIGEIPNQITDDNGKMAGMLFDLKDEKIPIDELANMIVKIAEDPCLYGEMQKYTAEMADKFDVLNIAQEYMKLYCEKDEE